MDVTTKVWLWKKRVKKTGKYPVKIKVIFNREICFYQTGVDLTEDEFEVYHSRKDLKKKFDDIIYFLTKADGIIADLGRNFSWKEFDAFYYNRNQETSPIDRASYSLNIVSQLEAYANKLATDGLIKSSKSYYTTANHLKDYCLLKKDDSILLTGITPEFLLLLEKYFMNKEKKLSYSSVGVYMRNIRAIMNQAISKKIIGPESYPFGKGKYVPPATKKAKKSLSIEEIEKIYRYTPADDHEAWARDMWLFAYLANGMNVKDIALLKYESITGGVISYIRAKTKNSSKENLITIEVLVNEDQQRIITKWGTKPVKPQNFIFDILQPENQSDLQNFRNINQAVKNINKYMKRLAMNLKLERVPTTNFARHSFSTVLKRSGVPIEMISEQLGHTSIKTTQIYLGSFENAQKRDVTKFLTAFKTD